MIHEPPIDKMVEKVGNQYILSTVVAKRARQIIEAQANGYIEEDPNNKPISQAANEVNDGRVIPQED